MQRIFNIAALGMLLTFLAFPAQALVTLDFRSGDVANAGDISTDFSTFASTTTAIPLDTLVVSGTAFDGSYDLDGFACTLADGTASSCALLSFDTDAGTISIVGSVPTLGITSTTLLSGSISDFDFFGSSTILLAGPDTKDSDLLTALGLDPLLLFKYEGTEITTTTDCPSGVAICAGSTDVLNTSIPEPGSLLIFGTGLLGLGFLIRRRRIAIRS